MYNIILVLGVQYVQFVSGVQYSHLLFLQIMLH